MVTPQNFFSPTPSLKICGVTTSEDACQLAELGVSALGFNFWPQSKRFLEPETAGEIAQRVGDRILKVGVFVNNARPQAVALFEKGVIDVVQLHGDETEEDVLYFLEREIPLIRAVSAEHLPEYALPEKNFALLIDTPAGKEYGGTGKTFDWSIAREFSQSHPQVPVLLAGGLHPENAAEAIAAVHPAALDIASGAEISPGVKDFDKIHRLLNLLSQ